MFDTWDELQDYVYNNPDVMARVETATRASVRTKKSTTIMSDVRVLTYRAYRKGRPDEQEGIYHEVLC